MAGGEALLGAGEDYDTLLNELHLVYTNYTNSGTGNTDRERFLQWMRDGQVADDPVIFCVKYDGGGDPYYDHIIIAHAVSGHATGYYGDDIRRYSDHEVGLESNMTFNQWRDGWSTPSSQDYYLPQNLQYGTRIRSMEGDGETLPISLTVSSKSEPNVTRGQAPTNMSATVNMSGLTVGTTYSLLRWNATSSAITSVPFTDLLDAASPSNVEYKFTATSTATTRAVSFLSNSIAIFLLVPGVVEPGEPAPSITRFTPTSGPVGTAVTLTGSGFAGATRVAFNGTAAATLSVVSGTQIRATVPAAATSGRIAVTTTGGTGTSAASFTVTLPLAVTLPAITGSYAQNASLPVSWTTNQAVSSGEFAVWAQSASGWYIGKIVAKNATTSYSTSVTLAVPLGSGYRVRVGYRPTAGSGSWTVLGLSGGSFTVN
jgi:IPT/TIG domain